MDKQVNIEVNRYRGEGKNCVLTHSWHMSIKCTWNITIFKTLSKNFKHQIRITTFESSIKHVQCIQMNTNKRRIDLLSMKNAMIFWKYIFSNYNLSTLKMQSVFKVLSWSLDDFTLRYLKRAVTPARMHQVHTIIRKRKRKEKRKAPLDCTQKHILRNARAHDMVVCIWGTNNACA